MYLPLRHRPQKKGCVTREAYHQLRLTSIQNFDVMTTGNCLNVRHRETAHRGIDILPQSPRLGPQVTRTPTPPWATSMEVAGPKNRVADADIVNERSAPSGEDPSVPRKAKRVRVRLDTRIELTDEELKVPQCFSRAY
jgi:hypothetical protein